jgi:hypothetical protein
VIWVAMKRFLLVLPLAVAACGDGIQAKLDRCKDGIRSELTDLLERTKHDTAESMQALEPDQPADNTRAREASGAAKSTSSNERIKAVPDMFAAMAVPMIEAQLQALDATPAGLAKCEELLAQARQK